MSRLIPRARLIYPALHRRWDGGPAKVAGLVREGDEIAGFEVMEFPGHAPGMIGLWRESDRVAICSDTVYFGDSETFKAYPPDEASVPHPCWNFSTDQARESIRKLAALKPAVVAAGHEEPRRGPGPGRACSSARGRKASSSRGGGAQTTSQPRTRSRRSTTARSRPLPQRIDVAPAVAREDDVAAGTAEQAVASGAAPDPVPPKPAAHDVAARSGEQAISPAAAAEDVASAVPGDAVVARAAIEAVLALEAEDAVVAAESEDAVAARGFRAAPDRAGRRG